MALITCNLSLGELFPALYTSARCYNNSQLLGLRSFIYLAEHPYKSNHQHNCTGLAEAVNKYKSDMEFLPLFFPEILTYCDLLRTFWGWIAWIAFPVVVTWILGAASLIDEKLMYLHREVS